MRNESLVEEFPFLPPPSPLPLLPYFSLAISLPLDYGVLSSRFAPLPTSKRRDLIFWLRAFLANHSGLADSCRRLFGIIQQPSGFLICLGLCCCLSFSSELIVVVEMFEGEAWPPSFCSGDIERCGMSLPAASWPIVLGFSPFDIFDN